MLFIRRPHGNFKLIFYIFDNYAYRTAATAVRRSVSEFIFYIYATDLFRSRLFQCRRERDGFPIMKLLIVI